MVIYKFIKMEIEVYIVLFLFFWEFFGIYFIFGFMDCFDYFDVNRLGFDGFFLMIFIGLLK